MKTIHFTYGISITDHDIDDIMVTALEGGINYHVAKVEVVNNDYCGGTYASDVISRGGSLILHDIEDKSLTRTLTKAKLLKGIELFFKKVCEKNPQKLLEYCDAKAEIDPSNLDADDVDAIIQYAVFGEIIMS